MNHYLIVLKKYAVFSGRASRKEFWYFTLFDGLIQLLLLYLIGEFSLLGKFYAPLWLLEWPYWAYILISTVLSGVVWYFWIYVLAVMVPRIAVLIRRMHDVGKSAWYLFIVLIPVYGVIKLLILLASDSQNSESPHSLHPEGKNDPDDDDKKSSYCTKCGKKKDDDSKFCTNCGNKN